MATPDYTTPNYTDLPELNVSLYGAEEMFMALRANLIRDMEDAVNSKIVLANATIQQTITTPLIMQPSDGDPDDNSNNASNIDRPASRRWCGGAFLVNKFLPWFLEQSFTITQPHVYQGTDILRINSDPTLANTVCRKSYVDTVASNAQSAAISGATSAIQGSSNTWTNQNIFSSTVVLNGTTTVPSNKKITFSSGSLGIDCSGTVISLNDLKALSGVSALSNINTTIQSLQSSKQDAITSSSDISMRNLTVSGTVSLPTASLSQASVSGLVSKFSAVDASLNSLIIAMNDIGDGIYSFDLLNIASANVDALSVATTINLPDASITISKINGLSTRLSGIDTINADIQTDLSGVIVSAATLSNTVGDHTTTIADIQSDLSGVVFDLTNLSSTVGSHTTSIGTINTSISSNSSSISSLNSTIGSHTNELNQIHTDVSAVITNVEILSGTLTNHNSIIADIQSDLSGVIVNATNLSNTVNGYNAVISDIQSDISGALIDISNATTAMSGYTSSINSLNSNVSQIHTDVSGVITTVGSHTAELSQIHTDVSGVISTVSGHTSELTQIHTDVSGVISTVSGHTSELTQIHTDVSGVISTVSGHTTQLSQIHTDVSGVISTVNGHTTQLSQIHTDVSGVISTVNGHTTQLSQIHTDVSNVITDLQALETTVSGLSGGGTIADGSITDSMLASTFVKPNTAPTLTGTNFTNIPQSAITNLSTDLAGKQATLTSGSVSDSMLASTFLKPNTAITITSINCTSETDSGNGTFGSISEKYTSIGNNGTTNSYTLDYSANTAVYILSTAPTANMTIRLNNCGTDTTKNITFAVIYNTTGKYYANSVSAYSDTSTQITLASSTPLFAGGSVSISSSTIMVQTFTLMRNFASNYVLSSVVSYY